MQWKAKRLPKYIPGSTPGIYTKGDDERITKDRVGLLRTCILARMYATKKHHLIKRLEWLGSLDGLDHK
jgi:hypothetical protein